MATTAPTRHRPQTRDTLFVSEVFSSFQGEGPHCGQPATFLRLMGCNLTCSWCDTKMTWDHRAYDLKAETSRLSTDDVYAQLCALHAPRLVITGGEPLLQALALGPLVHRIAIVQPWQIEVETNGTIAPPSSWLLQVGQWNVSPKLDHSGNDPAKALNLPLLRVWASMRNSIFKFVVKVPADVAQVAQLTRQLGLEPQRVWAMPEGVTAPVLLHRLRLLTPTILEHGFCVAARLHILAFGNTRGT